MLRLMSGAWATQAVRAVAELGIADLIGERYATTAELATLAGCDADALDRLLLYLTSLGVFTRSGDGYTLTEAGQLLRTDVTGSVHPLALLYGGIFYDAFSELAGAIRTGENAFVRRFGCAPFEYLSRDPEQARIFHRGMMYGSAFFCAVPAALDLDEVGVVIDLGGGTGTLLAQILAARAELRGVLVDLPHVLDGARAHLAEHACLDRCQLVSADLKTTPAPPGGDVYVLSRILHDWPDDECLRILRNCRAGMAPGARLAIIERPIPADEAAPTLARSWDVHMMVNNVGGRERTRSQYQELLADAGFEVRTWHPLPLEMELLIAAPPGPGH
jgi:O-methyltransferase domain